MGNTFNTNLRWVIGSQVHNNILLGEPAVFIYAQEGAWGQLIEESFSRPSSVSFKDRCRNTALHIACRRQPPIDVIVALIRAYPAATELKTVDGMTPLHFACYCGASVDIIKILIEAGPESVSKVDSRGRTPLHCACAGFRTDDKHEILKALLDSNPNIVLDHDNMGRTSLSLMLDDYLEEVEEIISNNSSSSWDDNISHSHRSRNTNRTSIIISKELEACLKCTSILLRAAYHGSTADIIFQNQPFRLLHASVGVPSCPHHFIRLALKIKPEQIREPDINGNLPLHIAASISSPSMYSQKNVFVVIETILGCYPKAARISNKDRRLPLALAIESRKTWENGIRVLIEAHPAALSTIPIDAKYFHLILERIAKSSSPTVLFEVLKAKPEIVPSLPSMDLMTTKKETFEDLLIQDWDHQ